MRIWLLAGLLWALVTPAWAAAPPPPPAPLTASEADRIIQETTDFVIDLYVVKFDWIYHVEGDYDRMVKIGYLILDLDPHYIEMYTASAYLLWSLKRYQEAEALYREGMENNPKDYEIPMDMGTYLLGNRRRPDLAVPLFKRAVENGAGVNAERALGNTLDKIGRTQEAFDMWQKIVKKRPTDGEARRQLEKFRRKLERKAREKRGEAI